MRKYFFLTFSFFLFTVLAVNPAVVFAQSETSPSPSISPVNDCVRAGCSGEACVPVGTDDFMTTCVFLPEFACYQEANCERQTNGQCGFTITTQVQACLDEVRPSASPSPLPSPSLSPSPSLDPTPQPSPSLAPNLIGDFNNDGKVNLLDYAILVHDLFKIGNNLQTDLNGDGKVNLLDYSILIVRLRT